MISFPLSLVLIPYGIVVLIFILLAAYSVHNLVRYGATTNSSFFATFAFLAGAVFVMFFTWSALRGTDWTQEVTIGGGFSVTPTTKL
ncbi:MAG TPA: hypothetical protein VL500_05545 [Candidatus Eisenbacteria bacterium]|jgi:hypothetical protein|nr:hypothetical protein [Candidatus Eisenbacteria bacterium]